MSVIPSLEQVSESVHEISNVYSVDCGMLASLYKGAHESYSFIRASFGISSRNIERV